MKLNNLPKILARPKKRLGRGLGSGKGKTGGRGMKGQKARGRVALGFIGGTLPIYKKIPYRRGLGNKIRGIKMLPVPVSKLSIFKVSSTVNLESLITAGIVKMDEAKKHGVKIVNGGNLSIALTVNLPVSKTAAAVIEKAGGKVVNV